MAEPTKDIIPEQDLKPLMDEVDRILGLPPGAAAAPAADAAAMEDTAAMDMAAAEGDMADAAMAEGDAMAAEDMAVDAEPVEADASDVTPIADALGVSQEQAQALYEASQQMGSLEGMNPQEVADALSTDFQLRMQVEKLAGRAEDESAEAVMEEEVDTEMAEEAAE
jgi:hypothetical protein